MSRSDEVLPMINNLQTSFDFWSFQFKEIITFTWCWGLKFFTDCHILIIFSKLCNLWIRVDTYNDTVIKLLICFIQLTTTLQSMVVSRAVVVFIIFYIYSKRIMFWLDMQFTDQLWCLTLVISAQRYQISYNIWNEILWSSPNTRWIPCLTGEIQAVFGHKSPEWKYITHGAPGWGGWWVGETGEVCEDCHQGMCRQWCPDKGRVCGVELKPSLYIYITLCM